MYIYIYKCEQHVCPYGEIFIFIKPVGKTGRFRVLLLDGIIDARA